MALLKIYGRLLEEKKDLKGAAGVYERIIDLDPGQQNTYLFLGAFTAGWHCTLKRPGHTGKW